MSEIIENAMPESRTCQRVRIDSCREQPFRCLAESLGETCECEFAPRPIDSKRVENCGASLRCVPLEAGDNSEN